MADYTEPTESTSVPKTREPTSGKKMRKKKQVGELLTIEFDDKCRPIGPNANDFSNYIGTLVRHHVDINIKDWTQVSKIIKDSIWLDLKVEKCEEMTQGSFQPARQNDILSAVLGTNEHGGYVRGVGVHSNLRDVFGKPSYGKAYGALSCIDLEVMEKKIYKKVAEKIRKETMEDMQSKFNQMLAQLESFMKNAQASPRVGTPPRSSCQSIGPLNKLQEIPRPTNMKNFESDIKDLLTKNWLDVSIIQVFIIYLYQLCKKIRVTSIGFVCPRKISKDSVKMSNNEVTSYLINVMLKEKDRRFILAPYQQETFRSSANLKGQRVTNSVKWRRIECHQQLGTVECRYYVLRYMYEICALYYEFEDLEPAFAETKPYTMNEIYEIRKICAKYFCEECL